MSFSDYIKHYLAVPKVGYFFLISFGVVLAIHFILSGAAKVKVGTGHGSHQVEAFTKTFEEYCERYYELMFSSTSILFFTSIYFGIDFDYFNILAKTHGIWDKYQDFLLLGFIVISILFNSIIDHWFVPLRRIDKEKRNTLRMTGMLYMLVIFAYIKYIYEDDNYDTILVYFLTLVIGRFVYFDASIKDFWIAMKNLIGTLPILGLVLLSTALLAMYGFTTGYLLRSNGVVLSLFIAHFFGIIEIFILARTGILTKCWRRKLNKKIKG